MLKESVRSVLPVSLIILVLCFTIAPIDISSFTSFLFGAVMIIVGMALFSLGAEMSMTPMGEYVGSQMTKSKKIWLIVILSFIVGFMITMSEPDLQLLAKYAPQINDKTLIFSVSGGVGIFLVVAGAMTVFLFSVSHSFYPS
jgi:type III secretory pathway component EscT